MENISYANGTGDALFKRIKERLKARLSGCDDLCNPMMTPFLQRPPAETLLCKSIEPVSIEALVFGFKKGTDPAGVSPLQDLTANTASGRLFQVGSAISVKTATPNQIMPLSNMKKLNSIVTYYVMSVVAKGDEAERYKRRIVAIYLDYEDKSDGASSRVICAGTSEFATIKVSELTPADVLVGCNEKMENFNKRTKDYVMDSEVNAVAMNLQPFGAGNNVVQFPNVAYREIKGRSSTYIENIGLVSTLKVSADSFLPSDAYSVMTFRIPFTKNSTGKDIEVEMEASRIRSFRSLIASSTKNDFSIGIPSLTSTAASGASMAIGQIAGYSYSNTQSRELEGSRERSNKATFRFTLPANAYLLDSLLQSEDFAGSSTITFYGTDDKELCSLVIPTNVPAYQADSPDALASAIVAAI